MLLAGDEAEKIFHSRYQLSVGCDMVRQILLDLIRSWIQKGIVTR